LFPRYINIDTTTNLAYNRTCSVKERSSTTHLPEEVIAIKERIEAVIAMVPPPLSPKESALPTIEPEEDHPAVSEEFAPYEDGTTPEMLQEKHCAVSTELQQYVVHPEDTCFRRHRIDNAIYEIRLMREKAQRRGRLSQFDTHLREKIASADGNLDPKFIKAMTNLLNSSEPTQ
jgi:hypothetical protein